MISQIPLIIDAIGFNNFLALLNISPLVCCVKLAVIVLYGSTAELNNLNTSSNDVISLNASLFLGALWSPVGCDKIVFISAFFSQV
jgi:hypothetical protein